MVQRVPAPNAARDGKSAINPHVLALYLCVERPVRRRINIRHGVLVKACSVEDWLGGGQEGGEGGGGERRVDIGAGGGGGAVGLGGFLCFFVVWWGLWFL